MRILLTGAFGNVGSAVQREERARRHEVICFDLGTRRNRNRARRLGANAVWGDIRRPDDVARAMVDVDAVIHLAAIIPPASMRDPELARQVNVEGTANVIAAAQARPRPPKLVHASSLALFGPTQHLPPPRTVADPIQVTDDYTSHKKACEELVAGSGLDAVILRLAAVIPIDVLGVIDPLMFEVPLEDRMEVVHPADAGLAFLAAAERDDLAGRILLIGGGPRCQLRGRDIVNGPLDAMGIGALPDEAFGTEPFHLDWADTAESEALLHFQRHTYDDCIRHMLDHLGWKRPAVRLARPIARRRLLNASVHYAGRVRR